MPKEETKKEEKVFTNVIDEFKAINQRAALRKAERDKERAARQELRKARMEKERSGSRGGGLKGFQGFGTFEINK